MFSSSWPQLLADLRVSLLARAVLAATALFCSRFAVRSVARRTAKRLHGRAIEVNRPYLTPPSPDKPRQTPSIRIILVSRAIRILRSSPYHSSILRHQSRRARAPSIASAASSCVAEAPEYRNSTAYLSRREIVAPKLSGNSKRFGSKALS